MARTMKDSGVEWLGKIPETWEMVRAKNVFTYHKDVVGDKEAEYERLALTLNGVIKRPKEDSKGLQSESLSTYQILNKKELVFKMIDLENVNTSRVGYSEYTGLVSPVYIIFNNEKYTRYGYYYFYNMWQREIFNQLGNNGVRSALNASDMLNLPFPNLPNGDAEKIASFLDEKICEIDIIVAKTKATIDEYKKYRSAIIDETIKNEKCAEYKFRYLGELKNGLNYNNASENRRIKFLGVGDFKDYMILNNADCFSDLPIDEDIPEEYLLKNGDIVFVRSNGSKELVGRSIMVEDIDFDLTYSGFCIRFRNQRVDLVENKYLLYFFRSEYFKELLKLGSVGANINNLSQDILNAVRVPIPAKTRQQKIIDYLDVKCGEIDALIAKKEAFIEEMEAYKKSLIYEYVTGKKEV